MIHCNGSGSVCFPAYSIDRTSSLILEYVPRFAAPIHGFVGTMDFAGTCQVMWRAGVATDTSNIQLVFTALKETILENTLRDREIL
ncbi:hypothetical protein METBIDRAFT_198864 [Metschnikowia bicuspidata var. bicuspidata NRRL YB-4993]|uniref:Uncharacterized protein n=1 Tax=Metschnikowia bicuspidata var. bicuspidata NRRL YB-4993 TaxID=869754 RepID=A0A1A0H8V5_9ASCO|nr:hypothetical protein METBIDRAFT_198864 [Metschnikowia bicuspidata var. bicuspidata NRRL YB-4993]OBA20441.1 hypothetical protein METBIDRAFT_198864 [Metschnikowia bicuspidata var. bicuspidata NRRL YB-4993]